MILSNEGIRDALRSGDMEINPEPAEDQYTTSAVDLFLGDDFRLWDAGKLQIKGVKVELNLAEQEFQTTARAYLIDAEREGDRSVILPPYSMRPFPLLALTREKVHLKKEARLAARVEGRSSLARIGLMVHLTAPTIHAGFKAAIALEMINHGPFYLKLVPNRTRICQLIFERLETPPSGDIATRFQGQSSAGG